MIKIIVTNLKGKNFNLEVSSSDSIESIKAKIAYLEGDFSFLKT